VDGQGSIGTPTTDGTVLIVPSGNLQVVSDGEASAANFTAYTLSGAQLWTYPFTNLQRNYAPIANGVAYLAADTQIVAVNAHTGTKLWSYSSAGGVEYIGAPAITPVGLFTADTDGAVIAFAPATSSADAAKSQIAIRRGTLYEPYGPIVTEKANGAYQVKY
jgi:outer membrane protein assembly factor BamB